MYLFISLPLERTLTGRGGTARNSGLRETLIHCGKNSKHRFKGSPVSFDLKNAVRNWPKTWAGPMDTCQYKLAVFAQGYGYTSAKERVLATADTSTNILLDKLMERLIWVLSRGGVALGASGRRRARRLQRVVPEELTGAHGAREGAGVDVG